MQRAWAFYVAAGVLLLTSSGVAEAIAIHVSGYSATPLVTLPPSHYAPSDIELDGAGNLYVPTQTDGIRKVTPEGITSLWSTAPAIDMTLTTAGDGYGAGRALCQCILKMESDGSYSTLHSGAFEWTWVKLSPDGTLYASGWAEAERGLYQIDRGTGTPSVIVAGGPGPAGVGWYRDMGIGVDGRLYVLGYDGTSHALLRLDGTGFTKVADLPHAGIGLTVDPQGIFYTATSFAGLGEVWMIDGGTATLLASDLAYPAGVAYDPSRGRLYVSEQSGSRQIWVITKDAPTPTRTLTWGQLKSRYREPAP